jgi:transposase InsO family protein
VPKAITVDNETQFDAEAFKEFCEQIGTKIHFASVRHPESNRLVERANDIIITGIMKLIFNQPEESGRMNLSKWCGATTQQYQGQQALHHSNYCLVTKQ